MPADKKEAACFYKIAADNGYGEAMLNYAEIMKENDGVIEDLQEAAKYLEMYKNYLESKAASES